MSRGQSMGSQDWRIRVELVQRGERTFAGFAKSDIVPIVSKSEEALLSYTRLWNNIKTMNTPEN